MNHTLFVKKCDQHVFDLGLLQTKLFGPWWWLWGPLHTLTFRLWVILKYPWLIPSYNAFKKTGIVLTSLDEVLAWCESPLLLLIRETVGWTLCRFSSSVNLNGGFDESSPYWCLIHATFWESIDDLRSLFHRHLRLCLRFKRLKDTLFLDHPEDPLAHLQIV
jgi:hypothetical protein